MPQIALYFDVFVNVLANSLLCRFKYSLLICLSEKLKISVSLFLHFSLTHTISLYCFHLLSLLHIY